MTMDERNKSKILSRRSFAGFVAMSVLSLILFFILLLFFYIFIYNVEVEHLHEYIFILLLSFAAFVAIVFCYYRFVFVPFKQISGLIRIVNMGHDFEELLAADIHLSSEMAGFMKRVQALTETQYKIKESKRQAEYLALQSQINPHFLYNTLEAIRGDALTAGMSSIAEITEALATFFRYTISTTENLVTLEDELTNVENYFIIQKYRFGDRLSFSIISDNDVYELKLPKMTLQPIIENAIYHGIERKRGAGNIKIVIETTRTRLLINVIDDGVGIEEDALEAINANLSVDLSAVAYENSRKGGIALINVNNRIKLLFGELYGLRISSTVGIGTDVEIILPLRQTDLDLKKLHRTI